MLKPVYSYPREHAFFLAKSDGEISEKEAEQLRNEYQGLTKIPAIETDADEKSSAVLSLIENLQEIIIFTNILFHITFSTFITMN